MKALYVVALLFFSPLYAQSPLDAYSPLVVNYDIGEESSQCEDYDLREEMSRRGMAERRYQGDSGWCYAFVTAELVSFELSRNISAADIARSYINTRPQHLMSEERSFLAQMNPLGGGFVGAAFEASRTLGYCDESEFPSEDRLFALEQTTSRIESGNKEDQVVEPPVCLNQDGLAELYDIPNLQDLLALVSQNDFRRLLNELTERECLNRFYLDGELSLLDVPRPEPVYEHEKNRDFYQRFRGALDEQRPMSISIDPSAFLTPRQVLRTFPSPTHQVVLVGRRFNEEAGRCEVLVRNSEGECSSYNQDYECQDNHAWVPRQLVEMGTSSFQMINR